MIIVSRTARMIRPFLKQWSRQTRPTAPRSRKNVRLPLCATSSIAPSMPMPRTSPTSGWSASSRMRFWKYGAISSRTRSTIFSRRMMLRFSIATAQQTGWPD